MSLGGVPWRPEPGVAASGTPALFPSGDSHGAEAQERHALMGRTATTAAGTGQSGQQRPGCTSWPRALSLGATSPGRVPASQRG